MYEQTLYKIVEPIKKTTLTRLNRGRKWKYGYDKDHDIVAKLTVSADDINEKPERWFLR